VTRSKSLLASSNTAEFHSQRRTSQTVVELALSKPHPVETAHGVFYVFVISKDATRSKSLLASSNIAELHSQRRSSQTVVELALSKPRPVETVLGIFYVFLMSKDATESAVNLSARNLSQFLSTASNDCAGNTLRSLF
ncbi:hypothetical protein J6590_103584, partial [Homalodisca vitripennis]